MSIRIKWLNKNASYDSITVYRDTKKIDPAALPSSLAVLSGGETSYLDTTAPTKTLLYYLIALKKGSKVVYSRPKPTVNTKYTGPGPQSIWLGDWRFGYFGSVTDSELFTASELCALVALGSPYGSSPEWHKFAFRGKVLYIPRQCVGTSVSWNSLYAKGLVFGADGVGPTGHSNSPVNQMVLVTKGDDQFMVRLPRTNNTAGFVAGTTVDTGEDVPDWTLMQALAYMPHGPENYVFGKLSAPSFGKYFPFAEFQAGALTAGCNHIPTTATFAVNSTNLGNCNRNTVGNYWRPVLEYVMR